VIRFLADEDFDNRVVRGLRQKLPGLDVITVQEAGLSGTPDPEVLVWAALHDRALLTHDARTMIAQAEIRIQAGLPMPGLFVVRQTVPIGTAIEELEIIAECSSAEEWGGQIRHLPLR
jgi:hypothetical protein